MSDPTATPEYEVHAIRYAHNPRRRLSENFLQPLTEPADMHESAMPMDFFAWALVGGGRTIVVDTSFDQAGAAKRDRQIVFPVEQGLEAVGVRPDAVADVVLTHMHWDHAGNNGLFPQARYHVQDREMGFCTGRCMCHAFMRRPFEVEDVMAMVRRVHAGDVQFHDGSGEVAPGVTVHLVGGHSQGLQVVRVRTTSATASGRTPTASRPCSTGNTIWRSRFAAPAWSKPVSTTIVRPPPTRTHTKKSIGIGDSCRSTGSVRGCRKFSERRRRGSCA